MTHTAWQRFRILMNKIHEKLHMYNSERKKVGEINELYLNIL